MTRFTRKREHDTPWTTCARFVCVMLVSSLSMVTGPLHAQSGAAGPHCEAPEVGREIVTLADGSVVYIEPRAFVSSDGITLLAGTPTYVFAPGEVGTGAPGQLNVIAGVILRTGRPAEPLPWPFEGQHALLRATERPGGGFVVGGVELSDTTFFLDPARIRAIWVAEWNDGWVDVARLPRTAEQLQTFNASSLIATSDVRAWAFPLHSSEEAWAFAVFERAGEAWIANIVVTTAQPAYVELIPDGLDLAAAVVQQDTGPGGQTNAIALYRRQPGLQWRMDGVLYAVGGVHHQKSLASDRGRALVWWEESGAVRGKLDPLKRSPTITIDGPASDHAVASVHGVPISVTHHVLGDTVRTVRIYNLESGDPRLVGEVPSPYTGFVAASGTSTGELQVVGARVSLDPRDVQVASLILRFGLRCPGD